MSQTKHIVEALIEIPRGSRNKYEFDERTGRIRLDRVLHSSVHYPTDYGLIPETLAPDGDHMDILVVVHEPTFPGCMIDAQIIGGLDMIDDNEIDFKILAVPTEDPRFGNINKLADLDEHWLREIENFFKTYKMLEKKETDIRGWVDIDEAWQVLVESREEYRKIHQAPGVSGIR